MMKRCLSDMTLFTQRADWSLGNIIITRGLKDSIKVSESDPVSSKDITEHLEKHELSFKTGHACLRTTCPRFTRPKPKLDKMDQLYVNSTTGYFLCLSCKRSGPWEQIRDNITSLSRHYQNKKSKVPACFKEWKEDPPHVDNSKVFDLLVSCRSESLADAEVEGLLKMLGMRGIHPKTLKDFTVRILSDDIGVVFPCCNIDMDHQYAKIVKIKDKVVDTSTIPKHNYVGLFGWSLAKNKKSVVLTSSEADAMAVYQETGTAAIALPRGISTLPQQALPFLESFNKITLWFDNTVQAFESAKTFAAKLGVKRTYLVRPESDCPSALKALQQGKSLKKILSKSISLVHEHLITFSHHRHDVRHELEFASTVAGVQWKNFPKLNTILKGHRRGELTVFTGSTGSGKTTFLSDYSLDLCTSGVNTLWGSFEISNIRLMKLMLQQYSKMDLSKNMEVYDFWADRFDSLSMYYMNYHGHESIKKVIDTMSHAVYIYDISHVIVDNLQFMMGPLDSGMDRFIRQDQILADFRKFATKMNCHVTLVIHPRKEDDGVLTTNSIFGGAKASQEADNILILQTKGIPGSTACVKYLQVTKNRFDGTLGSFRLSFNKECKSFAIKMDPQALDSVSTIPSNTLLKVLDENSGENSQW